MFVALGGALVLATWIVAGMLVLSLGLGLAVVTTPHADRLVVMRLGLWWGLLVAACAVVLINLVAPLHSGFAFAILMGSVVGLGIPGWLMWRRRSASAHPRLGMWWVVIATVAAAQAYLACAVLGPVVGYDTGLYHFGSVAYSADFATLPGLANLYGPLAYATVEFPLAALLGNGPWSYEGFRLLNGLLLGLVAADLVLRLIGRRLSVGTFVLMVGVTAAWIPMIAMADAWVTGPSQDCATLAVSAIVVSYLADFVSRTRMRDAGVSLAGVVLLVMLRPTMIVFALCVLVVVVVVLLQRRAYTTGFARAFGPVALLAAIATLAQGARDFRMSGWWGYPLSVHPFDVAWRSADPVTLREATLGFMRDSTHIWEAVQGWGWVRPWISRLPLQWEPYEFLALVLAIVLVWAFSWRQLGRYWRQIALAMVPSAVSLFAWFLVTPPAFRFIWGPFLALAVVPLGWALWSLRERTTWRTVTVAGLVLPVMTVTCFAAAVRMPWSTMTQPQEWKVAALTITYRVTPVRSPDVASTTTDQGLVLDVPVETDQCWSRYPLCTPTPDQNLHLAGSSLADGLLP